MRQFLLFFKKTQPVPQPWGAYHLAWIAAAVTGVCLTFLLSPRLRTRERAADALTAAIGYFLLVLEILKQTVGSLHVTNNGIEYNYPWSIFPFQLCSTPLYVCPFIPVLRQGKLHGALCGFLGTFGILGGICVLLNPKTVFCEKVFGNLHTMLWHTGLILLGVLQWSARTVTDKTPRANSALPPLYSKFSHANERHAAKMLRAQPPRFCGFIGSVYVFLFFLTAAVTLNFALPQYAEKGFDLFYVNPYASGMHVGFLIAFKSAVPYPVYLTAYACALIGGADVLYALLLRTRIHASRSAVPPTLASHRSAKRVNLPKNGAANGS